MTARLFALGLLTALLAGCASYTDSLSPCACDFRPIGDGPQERTPA